jgi:hypothetical protein
MQNHFQQSQFAFQKMVTLFLMLNKGRHMKWEIKLSTQGQAPSHALTSDNKNELYNRCQVSTGVKTGVCGLVIGYQHLEMDLLHLS